MGTHHQGRSGTGWDSGSNEWGHTTRFGAGTHHRVREQDGTEGMGHMSSGPGPEGRDPGEHVTGFGGGGGGVLQDESRGTHYRNPGGKMKLDRRPSLT